MPRNDLVDITLILDRSGSMQSIRSDTVGGVNAYVEEQQKQPGSALFTLIQFDDQYEPGVVGVDIHSVKPLTSETYVPRGRTALLDAMGRAINETGARLGSMAEQDRPGKAVFVIMTDGLENCSREFDLAKINQMVEHQKTIYSWDFVYLGANQDAVQVAATMGIPRDCALTYEANAVGAKEVFKSASLGTSRVRGLVASGAGGQSAGYFSQEDRDAQAAAAKAAVGPKTT